MRLRALFGLTILLGSLVACATGGKFQGSGGNGEGGGSGGGDGGGTTSSTAMAGGGTTTDTGGTTTDTGGTTSTTGMTTTTTAPPCDESPCKLVSPQCGCDGDQMCAINVNGDRLCHSPGDTAIGDVCVGLYSCVPGGLCIQASGSTSLCSQYCEDDNQCPGAAVCILELNDPQTPGEVLPDIKLCSDDCNPITTLGCPSGESLSCQIYTDQTTMVTFTLCAGAGTGAQNDDCTAIDDCLPGHSCFTFTDGSMKCLQYCNVNNPSCVTCQPLDPPLLYNGVNYGACL